MEIGQDVHIVGGSLEDAINKGIGQGYTDGYLRKSVVKDPLDRVNTGDNTPGVINYKIVKVTNLRFPIAPKALDRENMSRLAMLKPADGIEGVKRLYTRNCRVGRT